MNNKIFLLLTRLLHSRLALKESLLAAMKHRTGLTHLADTSISGFRGMMQLHVGIRVLPICNVHVHIPLT